MDSEGAQASIPAPVYLDDFGNPTTGSPTAAQKLQSSVSYGVQQDPVAHAKLLQLQQNIGIPPAVSQGNEPEVQQAADAKAIDYQQFSTANPRTTAWASNPDNAAVSGVDEIHRLGGIEQNAAAMRSVPAQASQTYSPWRDLKSAFIDAITHPVETLVGADTPQAVAEKQAAIHQMADQTGDPFFSSIAAMQETAQKPMLSVSGSSAFRRVLDPKSQNLFSRAVTGGTKAIEALSSPDNLSLLATIPLAPADAAALISGVFGTQMAQGAASGGYGSIRAAYNGEYGDAAEQGAAALISAAFAVGSGKHALADQLGAEVAAKAPIAGPFLDNLSQAVDAAGESKLRDRSPDKFYEATQAHFEGDASLRIPADQFSAYFKNKGVDPASIAEEVGSTNYAEAVLSGGEVEIPPADFLSKLDPEHQQALMPDVIDPSTGMNARQHQENADDLREWVASGGADRMATDTMAADAETAASPEFQAVKEQMRQRYVDAGESSEVADTLAEKDANVYSNIAKNAGLKPSELVGMYNPKITVGEVPGGLAIPQEVQAARDRLDAASASWHAEALKEGKNKRGMDAANATLDAAGRDLTKIQIAHGLEDAESGSLYQSSSKGAARGWFKINQDGSYEIGRTKIGDLSTFAHESSHAYLHILSDLALRDGASEVLKSDHAKILEFLGANPGDELTTEQQEKWAQANEQYLREGKAPSAKLRGAFQRFGVWLQSVYKKASDLGVELNDNIRGVLDRLYASEDGVNRAAAEAGPKMFSSAEEAGWTEEQFKTYADAHEVSVEQAKAHILSKLNEAHLRERSDAWHEEEQNTRAAVTAEIDQRPEYAAIRALRKGELDDKTPLTMSKDELVKQFGEERVKQLQKQHPGTYRNEGGVEPETAAEILGFNSAEEMLRSMESAPRRTAAIDQATREFMTAKHGDIRYDGSLKEQSDVALMNEERAKNLHRELAALNRRNNPEFELRETQRELKRFQAEQEAYRNAKETKKTARDMESLANTLIEDTARKQRQIEARDQKIADLKQKIEDISKSVREAQRENRTGTRFAQAVAPIESYREAAHQMIESKAVADIQPGRYLDASRIAAREAFQALAKGDYWEAKQAKHKELMNHFLFREATRAKEFIGKFETYVKRTQGKSAQQRLGLAGLDYRDQLNRLLFRYGLGAPPAEAPMRTLAQWADDLYDRGAEPALDASIYNESRIVHYRQASVAEVHNLHDALINIKHLASQELGMTVNGKRIEFGAAMNSMSDQARESLKSKPTRVLKANETLGEKITDLAQRGDALLMRTERLMEWMDGGKTGPWHDNLWNLAADSQGNEYRLQEEVTSRIGDALEKMPKEQRAKMLGKVAVPGISETVTRHDLVSMAFNMGNEGNISRLEKTFMAHGWDPGAIVQIKGMLTREEWQFVQNGWDSLKPLGHAQSELEKRLTGLSPVMVEPTPLHVAFADGSELHLDGGYYPVVMDPRFSKIGATQDAGTTAQNLMEAGYGRASTSRGAMKERTGYGGPLQLDYEQVLTQHTAKVIKDISHREFMLAANKILIDPQIRQTMRETLGQGYEAQMMPWLRTIVNDRNGSTVQGLGDFSQLMRSLRTNLTLATLSFKISTSLLQWTHAPRMLLSTKPGSYAQAMVDFAAHPVDMTEQIKSLSPNEMAFRGENLDRDIRAVLRGEAGIQRNVARVGNLSIKYTDHVLSFPLWLSVYRDALKEHADLSEDRAQYLASHAADSAVRLGLGSGAPKDLPPIMRNNDLSKLLTMFYSFHNGIYGQVRDIGHQFAQKGGVGKLTYGMALSVLMPAILSSLVSGNGPKDGENKGLWAAKKALLFGADTIPLLRDTASAVDRDGDVKFTPLADVLSKGAKTTQRAFADNDDKDWEGIGLNYLEVGGDLAGVPGTTQAMKPLHYLHQVHRGNIEDPNMWDALAGHAPHK